MDRDQSAPKDTTLEKVKKKTKEPERYHVVMLNDDFTTMEFVIEILVTIFSKDVVTATNIMRSIHEKGRGIAGTYSFDIASTKVKEVHTQAKEKGYPLKCTLDKA
jgi:ATP-dependent Clp protease adaptor protein ClpS